VKEKYPVEVVYSKEMSGNKILERRYSDHNTD